MVMDQFISDPRRDWRPPEIRWPDGKAFVFTVFDDPDFQTVERGRPVYDFLASLGFRTTRGIFPGLESTPPSDHCFTCNDPAHRQWVLSLKERGFEMGWHGASQGTSIRERTAEGLERFRQYFGAWPCTGSQHYECKENIYWGDERLSSLPRRLVYNLLTLWRNHNVFHGHVPGHPHYWSDLCRERIRYVRNFVFADINTLTACPFMPYRDPGRPDVNLWYASTGGHNAETFVRTLSEQNQDRLEAEGGACIMYTHFAYQFFQDGQLNKEFCRLMERLSKKNGWFVPVGTLLNYIAGQRGPVILSPGQRQILERRWLMYKIGFGTA
jgi:hypothetical protein